MADRVKQQPNRLVQVLALIGLLGLYVMGIYGPREFTPPWWLVLLLASLAGADIPDLLLRYLGGKSPSGGEKEDSNKGSAP